MYKLSCWIWNSSNASCSGWHLCTVNCASWYKGYTTTTRSKLRRTVILPWNSDFPLSTPLRMMYSYICTYVCTYRWMNPPCRIAPYLLALSCRYLRQMPTCSSPLCTLEITITCPNSIFYIKIQHSMPHILNYHTNKYTTYSYHILPPYTYIHSSFGSLLLAFPQLYHSHYVPILHEQ